MSKKEKNLFVDLSDSMRETAKARYERLKNDREAYIRRAEESAQFTIPALFPKESDNSSTSYQVPHQSFGARGVNNLSSKLLLALFPANSTFFRLSMNNDIKAELESQDPKMRQEIEAALMGMEQQVLRYIETRQVRVTIKEALNQLVVAGNCLLFLPPDVGGAKLYRLSSYTVQRDALGNVLQIIACDKLTFATLPPDVQALVSQDGKDWKPDEPIEVYTHVFLEGDTYQSYQEADGNIIQGTEQQYPKDKTPWLPLRFVKVDGESYGRSFVEEYLGDLKNLDGLQEAILNYAAIAAHILFLVNPAGITQVRKIAKADTGDFVPGRLDDIGVLQLQKSNDMAVTKATIDAIEQRLSYCFMLNSAVQRNAERVTAEEIRYVANELEDTLGGVYSILTQELQLPLVRCLLVQLERSGDIPQLPEGAVDPAITTGLEALGRGHDLDKLQYLRQLIAETPGADQYVHLGSFIKAYATSLGIDTTGLIKTEEEIAMEQQQAMQAQMLQQAIPNATKGAMDMANAEEL